MKKLLFVFMAIFMFSTNVYAFELPDGVVVSKPANKNLMKPADWEVVGFKSYNDHTLVPRANIGTSYNNATRYVSEVLIPVKSKSKVCFSQEEKVYTTYLAVRQLNSDFEYLNNSNTTNIYPFTVPGDSPCFTTLDGSAYLVLEVSSSALETAKSANFQVEYDSVTAYVPYEEMTSNDTPTIDIKSSHIYVPDTKNFKCFVVRSDTTIRAYKEVPSSGATVAYRDYYYTSNYLYVDGTQSFSNYSALPVCLDSSVITDEYVYRNDFPQILLTFVLFVGIIWFLISKLIKTFFFGFKRR